MTTFNESKTFLDEPRMHDLYVKIPLATGFAELDLTSRQQLANALITPVSFRELLAPDLTEAECNWIPNHDLETIMRFRWVKQNLGYIHLYDNWAILHPPDNWRIKNTGKKEDREKWDQMINTVECEKVRVSFDREDKSSLWLHTYLPDVLKYNFDIEEVRKEYFPDAPEPEQKK